MSFVHGYQDASVSKSLKPVPALWKIGNGKNEVYDYAFMERARDFRHTI